MQNTFSLLLCVFRSLTRQYLLHEGRLHANLQFVFCFYFHFLSLLLFISIEFRKEKKCFFSIDFSLSTAVIADLLHNVIVWHIPV